MGLSFSLLLSAWNDILRHWIFGSTERIERVTVRSLSFERDGRESPFKTNNSKKKDDLDSAADDTTEQKLESVDSSKQLAPDPKSNNSIYSNMAKPTIELPEPSLMFSPRPVSELDAAATKLQKVYKSYRTRRNLADCAVVVEELWWKALDSAALNRFSVSFFNMDKPDTAMSRWARIRKKAAKVGKGLSKDEKAQKLALQHWLEAIDPRHRYGHNLHFYYDAWSESKSSQPFFYWLDVGEGKELNLETCPRSDLQRQCIKYLGPKEREAYEVIVEDGKLVYKQSGMPVNTTDDSKWIFVLSTSRALYVGQKKKGVFQHSSFLSGGAITAAGRLVGRNGVLEAIWPYSGHYLPTEDNFKEFISFLEEHKVDLTNVKMSAVDDDNASFKAASDDSKQEETKDTPATAVSENSNAVDNASIKTDCQQDGTGANTAAKAEDPSINMAKLLSFRWTSGVGPRIGCVRDYPPDMQFQALEKVNLSPKDTPGRPERHGPIPSPRPSPKIRVSPRLAYMGLPSPRVPVGAA